MGDCPLKSVDWRSSQSTANPEFSLLRSRRLPSEFTSRLSRTCGGRAHGRDFWPPNADASLIVRLRQENGERRVPWCSTVNHRANSHPDRNRSTILALTEDVRLCQIATNSWSAALAR